MKIGCDLQSVAELRSKPALLDNRAILTREERTYCGSRDDPWPTLGGILSAKEACFKALSGIDGIPAHGFREVEIAHLPNGRPAIRAAGQLHQFLTDHGLQIDVSISHSGEYVMAAVIVF